MHRQGDAMETRVGRVAFVAGALASVALAASLSCASTPTVQRPGATVPTLAVSVPVRSERTAPAEPPVHEEVAPPREPVAQPLLLGEPTPEVEREARRRLRRAARAVGGLSWLAFSGGAEPESTQVSLEQDLALVQRVFSRFGQGISLFAGGEGVAAVQVEEGGGASRATDEQTAGVPRAALRDFAELDADLLPLAELFWPRSDRGATYRVPEVEVAGPSTLANVERLLFTALHEPEKDPLLIFVGGHGEPGTEPLQNVVRLWGGFGLSPQNLVTWLDEAPRASRWVMTTCFSGGFAELAFRAGQPGVGQIGPTRCGVFASAWDREASGCDPNPARGEQEGYAMHFVNALRRRDREGRSLGRAIDYDGDGRISLLDAHTRARIASSSIDVPVTTSERWLEAVMPEVPTPQPLAGDSFSLPEEGAVVARLGRALGVRDWAGTEQALSQVLNSMHALEGELDGLHGELDARFADLRMALLARWPRMEDPLWFASFIRDSSGAAEALRVLRESDVGLAYTGVSATIAERTARLDALLVREARLQRVLRAYHTEWRAQAVSRRGGHVLAPFTLLRECERWSPP